MLLDFANADKTLIDLVKKTCSEIHADLFDDLINKKLFENEKYLALVKPEDGDEFQKKQFVPDIVEKFKLIFLTTSTSPNLELAILTTLYKCI
jgi:hypothetical protein